MYLRQSVLIFVCFKGILTWSIFSRKETKVQKEEKYNPDEFLDVPQLIARHGYPSESHTVQTVDGYLLTMHRIPGGKNGTKGDKSIFLQHGLLGSSADWLINGNTSLGFLLADNGYDVWLGNARGNFYSKAHVNWSVEDTKFWNFSWNEMGEKDLPAYFEHIQNTTGHQNLTYIGHSMGTTMFFVLASTRPDKVQHIDLAITLAPIAYMSHVRSPIRYLAPFSNDIEWLARSLGVNQFLPNNKVMKFLTWGCYILRIEQYLCENVIFVLSGFDRSQLNQDALPVIFAKEPAGTSTKTVVHYAQEIKYDGNFQQFDYGKEENFIHYGNSTPPQYNLTNIDRRIFVFFAENDWLASPIDVKRFSKKIRNLAGVYKVPLPLFNHIDFLFGKDASKVIYEPILNILKGRPIDEEK